MDPVSAAFEPVVGRPAWLVRRGYAGFLTLEFGPPAVEAPSRAPIESSAIHGAWHLWIYSCAWSISVDGIEIATVDADDTTIDAAVGVLDGRALTRVEVAAVDASSRFTFDAGRVLTTWPWPAWSADGVATEQWLLYQPGGQVLTVRSDGCYSNSHGSEPESDASWHALVQA